jgi:hypothetical protein
MMMKGITLSLKLMIEIEKYKCRIPGVIPYGGAGRIINVAISYVRLYRLPTGCQNRCKLIEVPF